jgi:hypothetical protein
MPNRKIETEPEARERFARALRALAFRRRIAWAFTGLGVVLSVWLPLRTLPDWMMFASVLGPWAVWWWVCEWRCPRCGNRALIGWYGRPYRRRCAWCEVPLRPKANPGTGAWPHRATLVVTLERIWRQSGSAT